MKRIFAAVIIPAVFFSTAGIVLADHQPTRQHIRQYVHLYRDARKKFGAKAVGCNLIGKQGSCHKAAQDSDVVKSIGVLQRILAPQPPMQFFVPMQNPVPRTGSISYSPTTTAAPSSYSAPSGGSGGYGNVPGVPSSFASCVAMRESTNGAGSPNIYGILPSNGYTSGMSVSAQKALFSQMYAAQGAQPWAPYDGC